MKKISILIPCYNEEKVLPITSTMFEEKIKELIGLKKISRKVPATTVS